MEGTRRLMVVGCIALAVIGVLLATMAWANLPPTRVTSTDAAFPPPHGFEKLDGPSRALAESLEPGELVTATLAVGDEERAVEIARRARAAGLTAHSAGGEQPQVAVMGLQETVIALAGLPIVARATLTEDMAAMRKVASPLAPGRVLPSPGAPYLDGGLPVDPSTLAVPPERRGLLLAALANIIMTIDGRPYAEILVESGCSGESITDCYITLQGAAVRGGERRDRWPVQASAATGWLGFVNPGDPPTFRAVPRWLAREAERIARSDGIVLAEIRRFAWIEDVEWNPASPGVVDIRYGRSCALGEGRTASARDGFVAENPGCYEALTVTVDVAGGRVVATR